MEPTYKKSKGNAGLEGIQFQLDLLIVFLLNAARNLKNWKISSENKEAGKYDDLVLELPDRSVFLQAKFKYKKKINKDQLLSSNSKNSDFSLAKYFFSYVQIKSRTEKETVIICTNTNINQEGLENVLTYQHVSPDSLLYHEKTSCTLLTFNKNILPDLKANTESYFDKNLQGKGIDKAVITDGNMEDFLRNLQFFCNYPSGDDLHTIAEQLLSRSSYLWSKTSYHEIYRKVEDWFKQPKGEYLTEFRTKAMLSEIRSDKYCESLKSYNLSFERNDLLYFTSSTRIFHIKSEEGYLLLLLKIFDALHSDKCRKLYVNPKDEIEVQKGIIEAFRLPRYRCLIMVWPKSENETVQMEICSKLREVLEIDRQKRVILVTEFISKPIQDIGITDISEVSGHTTFKDLTKESQERLIKYRSVLFQGNTNQNSYFSKRKQFWKVGY